MSKKVIVTENQLTDIIALSVSHILNESLICEMGMKASVMTEKYSEVIGVIVDNIVCICLYPDSPTIPHWKSRIVALCDRFIKLNIEPLSKNTTEYRYKTLMKGLFVELDKDYRAIRNHFKSVSTYYALKAKPNTLVACKPYDECYYENKDRIESAIRQITECVANQNMEELLKFVNGL